MDSVYSIFSISLTVVQSPFSHASLLTFLNPTDIHLVKCEPFCKWGLFWESHVSPPSLSLSLSSMHPREGCKSCCPLVMTESEEEPREKSSSIGAPISPLSVCVCLFHSHSAALSSSGMHLKETICWSICLLLCFLCHCLSPIDDQAWPFPCPPSLCLPTGPQGEAGLLFGLR